jgi:hypothetical protein
LETNHYEIANARNHRKHYHGGGTRYDKNLNEQKKLQPLIVILLSETQIVDKHKQGTDNTIEGGLGSQRCGAAATFARRRAHSKVTETAARKQKCAEHRVDQQLDYATRKPHINNAFKQFERKHGASSVQREIRGMGYEIECKIVVKRTGRVESMGREPEYHACKNGHNEKQDHIQLHLSEAIANAYQCGKYKCIWLSVCSQRYNLNIREHAKQDKEDVKNAHLLWICGEFSEPLDIPACIWMQRQYQRRGQWL